MSNKIITLGMSEKFTIISPSKKVTVMLEMKQESHDQMLIAEIYLAE